MRTAFLGVTLATAVALGCGSGGGYVSGGSPASAQCTAGTATVLASGTVSLPGMSFSPACAKVAAGTAVTFTNDDAVAHTVTADAGTFDHLLQPSQQVTITFPTAGTVGIHCTIHAGMRMTLVVQ
jgi:plastocyanin